MEAPPPLLVQLLGGNVVTTASVLACLNTADATALRRLHPALAVAVAEVPWADTTTAVCDADRWRAALPAAVAVRLAVVALLPLGRALTALGGVTELNLAACDRGTDGVISRLPPTLRILDVSKCKHVTYRANFTHLAALEWLDCSTTYAVAAGLARLPPSLQDLRMQGCEIPDTADFSRLCNLRVVVYAAVHHPFSATTVASLPPSLETLVIDYNNVFLTNWDRAAFKWPPGWSLAHLTRLRLLRAEHNRIHDEAIATLPASLQVLKLGGRDKVKLLSGVSFARLACLHTLSLRYAPISAPLLASLPPSLVSLDLHRCEELTPDAVFPHLPALHALTVNHTGIGDAAIASMPAGLRSLSMVGCHQVTQRARLGHLAALRVLQCVGTALSRATIASCRARGCFAPADGKLLARNITSLALLPDGRLVSGAHDGRVALLEPTAERDSVVVAELKLPGPGSRVHALAVLPDGHRAAVGTSDGIVVWDTREALHDTSATIACASGVRALVVAHSGRLVAGCQDGKLRVVDVGAGAVVATVAAHSRPVSAMAALLDGRVASVSVSFEIRVGDLGTGACVARLKGHTGIITALAVLPDGRLASGSKDNTVRLWDTVGGTYSSCTGSVRDHQSEVCALAVLPGHRLASLSATDYTIKVWDTCDDVGSLLARRSIAFGSSIALHALVALPGNRLAAGGESGVYLWQLPSPGAWR